jgi:hypothetical protein
VDNDTPHTLARISLRWMIRECFKTKSGIMFDADKLFDIGLDPASLYPNVLPRPPPLPVGDNKIRRMPKGSSVNASAAPEEVEVGMEEQEELHDAMSPIYDQLSLAKGWWSLEVLPMKRRYQRVVDDSWASTWKCVHGVLDLSSLLMCFCSAVRTLEGHDIFPDKNVKVSWFIGLSRCGWRQSMKAVLGSISRGLTGLLSLLGWIEWKRM